MNRLISVIMPVKDGELYLEDAILGIKKQDMDLEIIVVDDASKDASSEIAERLGCKLVHHEIGKGQVAAKNTGLKYAKGEYILFHDADDVMRDGVLKKMYDALETEASFRVVMAKVKDFVSPELSQEEASSCVIQKDPYYGLFTGAVLIKKDVLDAIGPFDEKLNTGEIIAFESELKKRGLEIKKLDFISTDRRVHKNNYGKTNREKEFKDYASVLRARMAAKKGEKLKV